MEQMTLDEIQEYKKYKEELKTKLDETAENFIVIGYILKQVRDRRLYLNDGYSDINGFGMGIYGMSKATVSRFININTKFSVGGNSRGIKPEYKGYGRSKIQEMLNVDESDMELITADTTVKQVQELKKAEEEQRQLEKKEQGNNLPLVKMAAGDGESSTASEPKKPFEAVMTEFWKENRELYAKVAAGLLTPEITAEEISPSGSRTYRNGVNIMFFYDFDRGLKLRSYEKGKAVITPYTYQELIERTLKLNLTESHNEKKKPDAETEIQPEKFVATPQSGTEEQPVPYIPMPGQISTSDLQDVMPEYSETVPVEDTENVIDGECRELDEKTDAAGDMENTAESTIKSAAPERVFRGGYEPIQVDYLIKEYQSYLDAALPEKAESQICKYNCLLDALELLRDRIKEKEYDENNS